MKYLPIDKQLFIKNREKFADKMVPNSMAVFNSNDVYNILFNSIFDPNPVLILEHRWLYDLIGTVKPSKKIKYCEKIANGSKATIVAMGNTVLDAYQLKKIYMKKNISFDIFKIISMNPLKINNLISSLKKTKNLILLEPSHKKVSISSEIVSQLNSKNLYFKSKIISMPDIPTPTSYFLTKKFYPDTK